MLYDTKEKAAELYYHGSPKQVIPLENRKTAIYCRTAIEDDGEIEYQMDRLSEFAEDYGYINTSYYIDNGKNGRTLNRPAMSRLIEDIRNGDIQYVLVTRADRIARDLGTINKWTMLVEENGVKCVSLDSLSNPERGEFAFWSDIMLLLDTLS